MSEKNDKEYGIVYLLTNDCMPGIVKIGMTSRNEMDKRLKELYTTGVPMPFECAYACKVKPEYMAELESALHQAFAPQRVNENREFFRIKPEQAIPIMKVVNHFHDADVTAEVTAELNNDLDANDKEAIAKSKAKRRPNLNFYEMGLQKGDMLFFVDIPDITCTIVNEKRVMFKEELMSLTKATKTVLGKPDAAIAPTPYWTINGKSLSDIYNETYTMEEE